nr:unnamed protein product [Callosobruchus analis]
MLIEKLQAVNINTTATDDAGVLTVETAIEESKHEKRAIVIGGDIDLLVILIRPTGCHEQEIFFKKIGKANVKTQIYSSTFKKLSNLKELAEAFEEKNCPAQRLFESGSQILLAVYNAPKSVDSIDHLRYAQYVKLTKLNKPVQLTSLPPTSGAAHQYFNRAYYQVQTWLGNDLEPQEWGLDNATVTKDE